MLDGKWKKNKDASFHDKSIITIIDIMPIFFILFAVLLALPVMWPQADLLASGLFYRAGGGGFFWADNFVFVALHWVAYDGARVLAAALAAGAIVAWVRHSCSLPLAGRVREGGDQKGRCFVIISNLAAWLFVIHKRISKSSPPLPNPPHEGERIFTLPSKSWLFLLLALLIGPGLVANVGFKDHWGRARPREVVEFGGVGSFSPALVPQFQKAHLNGSFVSGDAAFGFFLPAFAYVAPRRLMRRVFWGGMAAGAVFGFIRLAMGAHFLSDIVYAAFFMLASSAGVHAAMYGRRETIAKWKAWFARSSDA